MPAQTTSFHQERHFAAQFSGTSARDRAQNFSQAFAGSDFISAPGPTLPAGGATTQDVDMVEEDDDQFAFNFPGPGSVPMSPTSQSDQAIARSSSRYEENYVFKGQPTPSRRIKKKSDLAGIFGGGSRWADDEVQASSSIISSSAASSVKGGPAVGEGSNWELNAMSGRKDSFSPQRSSTMLHRSSENRRETSHISSRTSTTSTSTGRNKGKPHTSRGDRVIYERLPAFDEHISRRQQQQQQLRHVGIAGSVTSERSEAAGPRSSRYTRPAHVSSFRVNNSSRSRALASAHERQDKVLSQSMHASRHFHQSNSRSQYGPGDKGEYTIEVKFAEEEIQGSPFMTKAFDTRKLVVSDMPTTASRKDPIVFHIDASQAGSGNIEIRVNDGRVPCSVENRGDHKFTASFLPENGQPHTVQMSFNDTQVEGSPWNIHIVDQTAVKIKGEERTPCHKKATVRIQPHGQRLAENDLDASIKGPTNQNVPYNLSSDSSGDTIITYIPTDVGDYTIRVKYGDHDVSGSPFISKAYNTGAIIVTPLSDGFVNQAMFFTIDVGEAGEGQLQIMVNNGNIPNEVEPQEPGKYRIKFIPTEAGMQQVDIHFNDHSLPCSPLTCVAQDLSATIVGLTSLIPVQTESSFRVQSQANISNVATEVTISVEDLKHMPMRKETSSLEAITGQVNRIRSTS
ncbi:filamin-A [Elysia marginata]|uniref:Filamin-A n=1 Tax=Elysia marginata TaxID=1093978 RepID=A0AAV4GDS6_9GAST|nr:filamin-A [Elysia marginata]